MSGFARFTVEPRYRMRETGDSVSTADQFFLKLSKRHLQGLHACGTPSELLTSATSDHVLEVNSSLARRFFQIADHAVYSDRHGGLGAYCLRIFLCVALFLSCDRP